jgi:hypothetical protein
LVCKSTSVRFPGQWRNLGGERTSPHVCNIGDKWLEVRATVRVSGQGGKVFETITPEAMKSATTVGEKNPTWKWTDHDPHPPAQWGTMIGTDSVDCLAATFDALYWAGIE